MRVEWSRLRILDAVARAGSVTRAAAMLYMTGPAVSQQLRRIEAEAGVRVVAPDGRGVRLTSEGRVLAGYASQVAELMACAENDLRSGDELVGRIRIGALASTIRGSLADQLSVFQSRHPRVELCVEDGETVWQLERLLDSRLDLVLAESWSSFPINLPAGVSTRGSTSEALCIALPRNHRLSNNPTLELVDLSGEVFATCGRDSDGHQALVQLARAKGVELDFRHYVADHSTQLALVRAGLAIACVPVSAQQLERSEVDYREFSSVLNRDTLLVTRDNSQPLEVDGLVAHLAATPDG
ncbi:LysR family transcriptional regulator [Microbacterium esteraromaticum]|uniref:LysR family transcriptional regulator n=1 Tax=Microbacterium esteraromaticum TaxID=57043 RepID=UPI000B35340B